MIIESFRNMPEKRLLVAGAGSEVAGYKKQASGNFNIEFKGFMKRKDLQMLLKETKAVIVASQYYETFGMIVIEAFASRVPVIVGDIGNIGSLVDDGINGVKFQYNSAASLIKAVECFEQLPREKLGENAYLKYRKYFTQETNYELQDKIYSLIFTVGYRSKL